MNTPKLILAECRNWFEDVHYSKFIPVHFFEIVRQSYG